MLQRSTGLSSPTLAAIADLERRVVEVDGGRLKLEWNTLRTRPPEVVNDVGWWDGDRLLGFGGLYHFGGADPEVTGMVDPDARRRGIGGGILAELLDIARGRGIERLLMVVPRSSVGGAALAVQAGGTADHSEHALVLRAEPSGGPDTLHMTLRDATVADASDVAAILTSAFDWVPDDVPGMLAGQSRDERTLIAEQDGRPVSTLRVTHELQDGRDVGGIYGFAVLAAEQGHGIGREILRRSCVLLRAEGATQVRLEVEVDNDRALGLYTSTGFEPVTTEDYYAIAVATT